MIKLHPLVFAVLIQAVILMLLFAWLYWRQRRSPSNDVDLITPDDWEKQVENYLRDEIRRTEQALTEQSEERKQHALEARVRVLTGELEALSHSATPDKYWEHLADCYQPVALEVSSDNEAQADVPDSEPASESAPEAAAPEPDDAEPIETEPPVEPAQESHETPDADEDAPATDDESPAPNKTDT